MGFQVDVEVGFYPPLVKYRYIIQGMGGRRSVAEDESRVGAAKSSDASQPVNLERATRGLPGAATCH